MINVSPSPVIRVGNKFADLTKEHGLPLKQLSNHLNIIANFISITILTSILHSSTN